MESFLNENFGAVKAKNSPDEALQRWRDLCGVVKNPPSAGFDSQPISPIATRLPTCANPIRKLVEQQLELPEVPGNSKRAISYELNEA
ncbi:hypothetical protein RHGRI_029924 [Rhododendron griersonianum]|uniref:Calcium-transporting P-type ATPase N-terminal autoinhibitory domain-containing protein n=1 Tax=Rhododendron griersonianum TaxID=479676 RepID=A0AAV6IL65_9ERIC|nr:hypothetical protein RHGRI_029924 [Rhododendron griersonianum]